MGKENPDFAKSRAQADEAHWGQIDLARARLTPSGKPTETSKSFWRKRLATVALNLGIPVGLAFLSVACPNLQATPTPNPEGPYTVYLPFVEKGDELTPTPIPTATAEAIISPLITTQPDFKEPYRGFLENIPDSIKAIATNPNRTAKEARLFNDYVELKITMNDFLQLDPKKFAPNDAMGESRKQQIYDSLAVVQRLRAGGLPIELERQLVPNGNKDEVIKANLLLAEKGLTTWAPEGVKVRLPQNDQEKSELFYSNWAKTFGVIEPWWKTYQSVVRQLRPLA